MEKKLEYPKGVNPKDYKVGVLIGRFQVDELHDGHKTLVDTVIRNHSIVILFLGVPVIKHGETNPLDFETRKMMLTALHPELIIKPLNDQRKDEDWSQILDTEIKGNIMNDEKALLYGSRGSFIPRYHGEFDTCELITHFKDVSGTNTRKMLSSEPINSPDFRKGVIYSNYGRYPSVWPCADVVVYDADNLKILLGRKPKEEQFRFIGGHVDPSDESYEHAALRELHEEAGGNLEVGGVDEVEYVCSGHIKDWRHERYNSSIKSALYLVQRKWGVAQANDDIEEVKWHSVGKFLDDEYVTKTIVPEHVDFMNKLMIYIVKNKLKS